MMALQLAWLAIMAVGMTAWVLLDARRYRRFALIEDTVARQRFYWRWTLESFVILVGASVVTLWLSGDLGNPFVFPEAFAGLRTAGQAPIRTDPESIAGMAVGAAVGLGVAGFLQWRRLRSVIRPPQTPEPLLPRNGRERLAALPLSLNAGVSEELFFRYALPLLLVRMTGELWIALVVSTIAFGLVHGYQGWKGMLATAAVGGFLAMIYLTSGSLLKVMILHALIDIVALIVRPLLMDAFRKRAVRSNV